MDQEQKTGLIADLLMQATARLEGAGVESARVDAELLLAFFLNKSRTELYLAAGETIDEELADGFHRLVERRAGREPVAYITGIGEFWSRTFNLSPAVLIPRPETEVLVEAVLTRKKLTNEGEKYLDLCCGSGIISITLALEMKPQFGHIVGSDISRDALQICQQNCINHGVEDAIQLVQGDLCSCYTEQRSFPLITANPPYVSSMEMSGTLQPEVVDFEPHVALDGGEEGLELINIIIKSLPDQLAPGGDFFMEIGAEQADSVRRIFTQSCDPAMYESIDILKDYSGRHRVLHARRTQ